ncbi:MAG: WbqC family protein [Dysgonamonadaceae bacterium]|jgi:hypothetical protein|nr:WbqC family protein [Dysgonamonadaceae bacterium]
MILLTSAYLAPVEYYRQMNIDGKVIVDRYDKYVKRTYRNRCVIATANGLQVLTVPVERPDSHGCMMKDIRIADHGKWQHLHWNAIVSAYGSSPFFEFYADDFRPFFEKKVDFLFDFNERLRETVCSLLDISPEIHYTPKEEIGILDLRETIKDATCLKPYYQVFAFRHGFQPNISIVDLLFNMGPESLLYLK